MRTIINFGAPLKIDGTRYKNLNENQKEQFKIIKDFHLEVDAAATDTYFNKSDSLIKPLFLSNDVKNEEFRRITANDTFYLLVSAGFVVLWLIIHTRSTFLTLFCIFIIAFSFGVTGMLCEYAVGMTYFNLFNNFATFIILGIAADDFFVFFDAWNQSG